MKFGYFSHVWGRPDITPGERYRELWNEIALADEVGFDYAFSVEHHFTPHESWMPSPALFCTGAALRTNRIRVGPMGYVPALHNPIGLAEEVAALDQVLDGRLELGLASGVAPDFFTPFGADFEQRKERTRETVDILRAAYAPGDTVDFTGPFHRYHNVPLSFGPVQRPHPPLWIPTRDRKTLRWLAEIGANTSSTMIVPRKALGVLYRHYIDWWRAAGHAGEPNIGYWTLVHVAETDEEAVRRATPHIVHTLTKTLRYGAIAPQVAAGPGADVSTATILAHAGDMDYLMEHNLVFVGSPETVAGRIAEAASEGVFNTLLGEFAIGLMSETEVAASTTLFATEVIPKLRAHQAY